MTMIKLDAAIEEEQNLLVGVRQVLSDLRDELAELREKVACGETEDASARAADIKRVTSLVQACIDTENRLGNLKERKAGIAQNGVAFDLEAAKSSIGGKLDRLRAARDAA